MADNGIQEVDACHRQGEPAYPRRQAVPAGLRWTAARRGWPTSSPSGPSTLATGAVRDVHRMHASDGVNLFAVGPGPAARSRWPLGSPAACRMLDCATGAHQAMRHGFKAPMDALPLDDGSLLVLELGNGSLAAGQRARPCPTDDTSLRPGCAGADGACAGRRHPRHRGGLPASSARIDLAAARGAWWPPPASRGRGAWRPRHGAASSSPRAVPGDVSEIDPANGQRRPVAENLPIGRNQAGLPPPRGDRRRGGRRWR